MLFFTILQYKQTFTIPPTFFTSFHSIFQKHKSNTRIPQVYTKLVSIYSIILFFAVILPTECKHTYNMKIRLFFWILLTLLAYDATQAQQLTSRQRYNQKYFKNVVNAYTEYLTKKTTQYWQPDSTGRIYQPEVFINPIYYRLFAPLTIYHSTVNKAMNGTFKEPIRFNENERLLPLRKSMIDKDDAIIEAMDKTLTQIYLNKPTFVQQTEDNLMNQRLFKENIMPDQPRKQKVAEILHRKNWNDPNVNQHLVIRKPNFWKRTANISLQFTQNYISSNWYKGGESNNSMLSGLDISLNYDDKQRIQFDNRLEWKLGFVTSRSDTVHKYKTNTDLLRLTSKLGLKAVSSWFYTIQAEFSTQVFSNYKSNSHDVVSSFMAPGYLKFDLGMDYKKNLKNLTFSAVISPLSYKLTYVGNDEVDVTKFGVEEGKKSKNDLGSNLQVNSKWTIIPNIIWESRLSYFTTYERAEAEWENTFNFQLNRYLSTKVFVHARFDDGVEKEENKDSFFQLSELLSFGLSYSF